MKMQIRMKYVRRFLADKLATFTKGETYILVTGAKVKYLDGGWWLLAGYAWDRRDIAPLLPYDSRA